MHSLPAEMPAGLWALPEHCLDTRLVCYAFRLSVKVASWPGLWMPSFPTGTLSSQFSPRFSACRVSFLGLQALSLVPQTEVGDLDFQVLLFTTVNLFGCHPVCFLAFPAKLCESAFLLFLNLSM